MKKKPTRHSISLKARIKALEADLEFERKMHARVASERTQLLNEKHLIGKLLRGESFIYGLTIVAKPQDEETVNIVNNEFRGLPMLRIDEPATKKAKR